MLALAEYEAGVHDGCGIHRSIADADPNFTLDDHICPVCAEIDKFMRKRAAQEHEAEKDYHPGTPRAGDGRSTSVRLLPTSP